MPKVKICGNTNSEDVQLAIGLGADYIGFIFAESKRLLDLNQAKAIIGQFPNFSNFVAVFLNQPRKQVLEITETLGIKTLQFHGEETALYCDSFMEKGYDVIKTFRVKDAMSLKRMDEYNVDAFLFDTFSKDEKGGTGIPFDWTLIEDKPYVHEKLFLAGGLNPENLENAIEAVQPFAVDVASGVESQPGKKDPERLKKFISLAKSYDQKTTGKS